MLGNCFKIYSFQYIPIVFSYTFCTINATMVDVEKCKQEVARGNFPFLFAYKKDSFYLGFLLSLMFCNCDFFFCIFENKKKKETGHLDISINYSLLYHT